jgi:light-regulated signal transduction histidine kinase (bacteriophytochrome)
MGVVAITALAVCATATESRRAEQDLRRRSAELRRSNEELEQFATVASHDLQEPLRMTASYLQLLERRCAGKLAPEEREYVHHALDSTRRMRELIDGLLAFSRLDSGAAFRPVDCERALTRALENLRASFEEAGATLERGDLPVVPGDETQLAQLFQNLIGNALKFRRPDRPARVLVDSRTLDGQWVFSVRDEGIGIEPAAFERIFLLFQRFHHRDEYPGAGLGLAICKKIVERHGGRIWVESLPGQGSTFSFSIPMAGGSPGPH